MNARPAPLALSAAAAVVALTLAGCSGTSNDPSAEESSGYVTDGKLTVATGEPAYSPWVEDDDPASGNGFEAAVAYAVADRMGFAPADVEWVRTTFDEAIAPGPKDFDLNLQQFSVTDERREAVDFSTPYYVTTQVVITVEGSPAASATGINDLKPLRVGAATGSTSLDAVEEIIAPDDGAQVFSSNDDAKLALQSGTVDAMVVDLPTGFYLTSAELDGGSIVGQLPGSEGGDEFGIVLPKDSPLTADVTAAVDELREDGTLDTLQEEWLGSQGAAPVLE